MRFFLATSVLLSLSLLPGGDVAADDARALLDRAIAAHGGAVRIEHTKKGHLKARIEGSPWDAASPAELVETFDLPNRYRQTLDGKIDGKPTRIDTAVTEKEGWIREGAGPVRDRFERESNGLKHWNGILALLLSLREEDIELTSLPEEKRDGRTLVGVRTPVREGLGNFLFDKTTGLVARARLTQPDFMGGQTAIGETLFDDYRDVQGVRYPMKFNVVGDKNSSMTITILSIEFRDTIDESVFVRPQTTATAEPVGEAVVPESEKKSSPFSNESEKSPASGDRTLIVVTAIAGFIIGTVWFIVRASKRGKQETPPS